MPEAGGAVDNASGLLLHDASFALEGGKIYDLLGRSGAGKSTLLRVCALMVSRVSGTLLLEGAADDTFKPAVWRKHVCLVPQHVSLVPGSIRDNLLLPWTLKVRAGEKPPSDGELTALLRAADLGIDLERDSSKLSGGQAARIALLRAFATRPKVLLLDEVDAALDDESSEAMSALTADLVAKAAGGCACLRIRHRASDGRAAATFHLEGGRLSVREGSVPEAPEPVEPVPDDIDEGRGAAGCDVGVPIGQGGAS